MALAAYPMFQPMTNSPTTYITSPITASGTTIPINDGAVLGTGTGPGIAVLLGGDISEEIYYATKPASGAGNLTGVVRQYNYTGTYGVAQSWPENTKIARTYASYDHVSLLANLAPIANLAGYPANMTLTKDNSGYERSPVFEKFDNNTIAEYTVTGTPTIASGVLTMAYNDKIIKAIDSHATTGKWDIIGKFDTAYVATNQYIQLFFGETSYLQIERRAGNAIYIRLTVNGASVISATNTTATLADGVYGRGIIIYDGTNYQMQWNGTNVGSATAGSVPSTPSLGVRNTAVAAITSAVTINEMNYTPSVAYTETFAVDDETRYMQLSSTDLTTWTSSAAGDVVVTTGSTKMTLASDDDNGVMAVFKSYMFGAGEAEFSFINNNDGGGGADTCTGVFGYQDYLNHYKVVLGDDTAGAENLKLYKVVAGSATQLGSTANVSASYTRGNKTWIKVQWDSTRGRMWVYLRDDAGTYPTTPNIADAFSAAFRYGKFGYRATVTTAGAGNLNVDFFPWTMRANSIVGETGVPATQSGFYIADEYSADSSGRLEIGGSAVLTYAVTGGKLVVTNPSTSANRYKNMAFPSKMSVADLSADVEISSDTPNDGAYIALQNYSTPAGLPYSGYALNLVADGVNNLSLRRYDAGTGTTLASATVSVSASTPYTIRLTWSSATGALTAYFSGALTVSATDTTYTSGMVPVLIGKPYTASSTVSFDNNKISGTRYYMKPQLRGALVGDAYINGVETQCTAFYDFLDQNTIGEYNQLYRTWSVDVNTGGLSHSTAGSRGIIVANTPMVGNGHYQFSYKFPSVAGGYDWSAVLLSDGAASTDVPSNAISLRHEPDTGALLMYKYVGGSGTLVATGSTVTTAANTVYVYDIVVYAGTITGTVYSANGTYLGSVSGSYTERTYGYVGLVHVGNSSQVVTMKIGVNAVAQNATNGIAASVQGVPNGGRCDVQEEVYFSLTNALKYGELALATAAITADYAADATEMYFINSTDTTAINMDGITTLDIDLSASKTWENFMARLLLRHRDIGDTIKISLRRKTFSGPTVDVQPPVWYDYLMASPIWAVA